MRRRKQPRADEAEGREDKEVADKMKVLHTL